VEEEQVRLIVEQVARLKDNLGGRFTHLENEINHQGELIAGRMENGCSKRWQTMNSACAW
jgi:hypothetical protein